MDLEKVRWKTVSQLDDSEKEFLRQNADKLNDEEKDAFKDFLTPDNPTPPADQTGKGEGGEGNNQGSQGAQDAGGQAPASGAEGGQPTAPATGYQFKSEEEAAAFVKKQLDENEKAKKAAIDAAATPAEKKWVEDNWKPKTWNEGIKTAAEAAVEIMENRQKEREKKANEARERAEKDWQALKTKYSLPELTTDEGIKIHNQIVDIGLKHGKKNFQEAYDLWSIIPTDKGGGYKIPASEAGAALAEQKKKQVAEQKKVAAKMGGGGGEGNQQPSGGGSLDTPDYKQLHEARSVRELLRKTGVING